MPWVRAELRGQTVLARANAQGELAVEAGRVEIRYKPNDGRSYRATAQNLRVVDRTPLPDDTCGAAEPAAPAQKTSAEAKKPKAKAKPKPKEAGAADVEVAVPDGAAVAYTDGACTGNPGPSGLGVVLLRDGKREELSEYLGRGTNNIAELTAILRALEMTDDPIVVHTDSQYAIGVLSKGWKAKLNVELIARIREAITSRTNKVRLVYVPGHAGVPLNERADELARAAIKTGQTERRIC